MARLVPVPLGGVRHGRNDEARRESVGCVEVLWGAAGYGRLERALRNGRSFCSMSWEPI